MIYTVLGSEGQIGSHLTSYLEKQGHEVIGVDIANNDIFEDLREPSFYITQAIEKADFIFFLAFDVGGSTYLKKYQHTFDFIANNAKIMTNTFDLLDIYNKPFIFASSQMSTLLTSPYGNLKMIGERYTYALKGMVCKFWNVYGKETNPEKFHVITDFILRGLSSHKITMKTDGQESRQFLYADDCSSALYVLSSLYSELDRTVSYDVTNFIWTKIYNLATMIAEKTNSSIEIGTEKDTVQLQRLEEPSKTILNYWQPAVSISKGLDELIEFYKGQDYEDLRIQQ